jgi:TolA-binding protein
MKKKKSLVKQFRSDDPSTYLTNVEQQRSMLLETLDMEMEKNKKEMSQVQKRINTKLNYVEPQINKDLDQFAESRARYETLRKKRKPPEIFEKNNSGLAGILAVSKRIKD